MTFLASGLIHEYVVFVFLSIKCQCFDWISWHYQSNDTCCFPRVLGNALFFFLWNGFLLFMEQCLKSIKICQHIASVLPSFVITTLVIMTALPISHWFTDPYLYARFYEDAAFLFPVVIKL